MFKKPIKQRSIVPQMLALRARFALSAMRCKEPKAEIIAASRARATGLAAAACGPASEWASGDFGLDG